MKFRAKNCQLSISLDPSVNTYEDQYESFSKIGDEFVCNIKSDDSREGKKAIHLLLPANIGVQVILEQVELSINDTSGSIQLDLNSCEVLLVNLMGNLIVKAQNSMIRFIGGSGELKADISHCDLIGVFGYSQMLFNTRSCNIELSSRQGCEATWSFYGDGNRILFDPEIKPNLMVSSVQDDWAHSGKNPEIFVNVFGEQRDLGFFDMEFNDSESPASIDTESLCTQDFLTESLETVESNEDLMNMFDHYEDQINTKLNELNESTDTKVNSEDYPTISEDDDIQNMDLLKPIKIGHHKLIMNLHLEGKISLTEMELLLKDLEKVEGQQ